MSDEKISQAERDEAAYFAERAKAGAAAARAASPAAPEAHTLFDVQEMELNFGPQHPSTHGVLRLVLKVDGEKILEAQTRRRATSTAAPRSSSRPRPTPWDIPHTDRMDYVAAATNNHAFCLAVEKLLGLEIPRRAQLIRVILDELQRLSSHLLWLGTSGIDLGAMTPFWYTFREREQILDFFEEYCGARLTLNCMRIGGLPFDLTAGWTERCREFIVGPAGADRRVRAAPDGQPHLEEADHRRRRDLRPRSAIDWGLTGPIAARLRPRLGPAPRAALRVLRGARLRRSRRARTADTYDRYIVRVQEMRQSATDHPAVPCEARAGGDPRQGARASSSRPPKRSTRRVESPKGELGFYCVSNGTQQAVPDARAPAVLHQPAGAARGWPGGTWCPTSSP